MRNITIASGRREEEDDGMTNFKSETYDLLHTEDGRYWTQYAVLGPVEAERVILLAGKGKVMAVGNRGDKHRS